MTGFISAGVGLVCLVAVALIWTVGDRHTPRIMLILLIVGVFCILGTPIGGWLQGLATKLVGLFGNLTGAVFGVAVAGVVAAAAIYVLVIHFRKKKVTKLTMACGVFAPLTLGTLPGFIGSAATAAMQTTSSGIGRMVAAAFGMG